MSLSSGRTEHDPAYDKAARTMAELFYPECTFPSGLTDYDHAGRQRMSELGGELLEQLVRHGFIEDSVLEPFITKTEPVSSWGGKSGEFAD